jgi:hypothetical protein
MKFIDILVRALALGLFSNLINAQVITIRVGDGPNCSTNNIQSAINSAPPPPAITQILIARTRVYNVASLDINSKNIFPYGGYADCNQVQFDSIRTEISDASKTIHQMLQWAKNESGCAVLKIGDWQLDYSLTTQNRSANFMLAGSAQTRSVRCPANAKRAHNRCACSWHEQRSQGLDGIGDRLPHLQLLRADCRPHFQGCK